MRLKRGESALYMVKKVYPGRGEERKIGFPIRAARGVTRRGGGRFEWLLRCSILEQP